MKKRVLIPFDGSTFSRAIFESVKKLLKPTDYSLVLLEVAPIPEELEEVREGVPARWADFVGYKTASAGARRALEPDRSAYVERIWKENERTILENMQEAKRDLECTGFSVETTVRFGEPVQEISDFVDREDIDLVAMATHGRTGVSRMVMGSVAEKVLRSLHVPVLMVRPALTLVDDLLPITEMADAVA
jgi:nucleotide-binding universal stress UspA family protein